MQYRRFILRVTIAFDRRNKQIAFGNHLITKFCDNRNKDNGLTNLQKNREKESFVETHAYCEEISGMLDLLGEAEAHFVGSESGDLISSFDDVDVAHVVAEDHASIATGCRSDLGTL